MPHDNAQVPPYSIFPGDVALAFNNEAPGVGEPAVCVAQLCQFFGRMAAQFAGGSVSLGL
jgi:hypothetical protein